MLFEISGEVILILNLVSFIAGLMAGVSLARPNTYR